MSRHNLALALLLLSLAGCRPGPDVVIPRAQDLDLPHQAEAVLVGAGDIARCGPTSDEETGRLVVDIFNFYEAQQIPVTVFTAGDNAYPIGATADFRFCYDSAWGMFKTITRPSPGNHEYLRLEARPYFAYFGKTAGERGQGFYHYQLAGWDIYSLNSEVLHRPIAPNTVRFYRRLRAEQFEWLDQQLERSSAKCSLAYWHHPRFNSGDEYGNDTLVNPLWRRLYAAGAEVIVAGHEHLYERFKPLRADGQVDDEHGIVEFLVGTGGASLRHFREGLNADISEKQVNTRYGVLVLALKPDRAIWRFVATTGETMDQGEIECHDPPAS
jgi:hypothetical protein